MTKNKIKNHRSHPQRKLRGWIHPTQNYYSNLEKYLFDRFLAKKIDKAAKISKKATIKATKIRMTVIKACWISFQLEMICKIESSSVLKLGTKYGGKK